VTLAPSLAGRGADSTGTRGRFRPGKLLVVSQVAVSLVLLIGAASSFAHCETLRRRTSASIASISC
jgi:hypothetical protein